MKKAGIKQKRWQKHNIQPKKQVDDKYSYVNMYKYHRTVLDIGNAVHYLHAETIKHS